MGFEPHSVAGSALKPASRLLLRGPAPSHAPLERGAPLSKSPVVGSNPQEHSTYLERAMGFEPTTTCLGSKDSTTELRPLAESNPTPGLHAKSRNSWQLPPQLNQRKLSSADLQAIGSSGHNG